jgi:cytochrome bd-type quinol oxidase subunit 2
VCILGVYIFGLLIASLVGLKLFLNKDITYENNVVLPCYCCICGIPSLILFVTSHSIWVLTCVTSSVSESLAGILRRNVLVSGVTVSLICAFL